MIKFVKNKISLAKAKVKEAKNYLKPQHEISYHEYSD